MKKLLDADITGENKANNILNEKITSVKAGVTYYIEHGIYFADTMTVFINPADSSSRLSLNADYEYTELDSIATELSGKDCYRALVFLKNLPTAYLSYHSYGDFISADTLNTLTASVEAVEKKAKTNDERTTKLEADFSEHTNDKSAHGASEGAVAGKIAKRTQTGTLKANAPVESDDLVTLQAYQTGIKESEAKSQKEREVLRLKIEDVLNRLQTQNPALSFEDFMPQGWKENQNAAEVEAQKQEANRTLNELINGIKPLYNAVRNKRGSITLPEPQDDSDAATKNFTTKLIQEKIAALINSAPAELDTLKELADALLENKDGITAINKALANRYTKEEADDNIKNQIASLVNNAPAELDTLKELADAIIKNKNDIENLGMQQGSGNKYETLKKTVDEIYSNGFIFRGAIDIKDLNKTVKNGTYNVSYTGFLIVFSMVSNDAVLQIYKPDFNNQNTWSFRYTYGFNINQWSKWQTIATTADINKYTPNAIKDYGDPNRTIQLGFAGNGLTAATTSHLAGFYFDGKNDRGFKIRDISKEETLKFLELTQKHIVDMIYPIGTVYLTMDEKDPKELFPGTKWKKISEGKYLAGVGVGRDVNKFLQGIGVGEGAGEYVHTLTVEELPEHDHTVRVNNTGNPDGWVDRSRDYERQYWHTCYNVVNDYHHIQPKTNSTGGNKPHNNMPPYFGVFVWQRTA